MLLLNINRAVKEIFVSRKLLKVLISLLFLIIIALSAIAVKTFMPELWNRYISPSQTDISKYGVAPSERSNISI